MNCSICGVELTKENVHCPDCNHGLECTETGCECKSCSEAEMAAMKCDACRAEVPAA